MSEQQTYFCDVSSLGKIRVSGTSAPEFIKVMTTVEPSCLGAPGKVAKALVLNAEGEILDLVMIGRTGECEYLLITHPDTVEEVVEWLSAHAGLKNESKALVFDDIKIEDTTAQVGVVALYGREASAILGELSSADIKAVFGEDHLALITVGQLQLMVMCWQFLASQTQDKAYEDEGSVYEVFLPIKASEDFKDILLGFMEIDPESFDDYKTKRRATHTWFDGAEQAAYVKPETEELRSLLRPSLDFVGAKALEQLGLVP